MSKRFNINMDEILKNSKFIDPSEYHKKRDEARKAEEERYSKDLKDENLRVENMECPLCRSTEKERRVSSISNGVMGPGYNSRKIADHYICMSCGIHYSDLNKKDIRPPKHL